MIRRVCVLAGLAALAACDAEVAVQTQPFDQTIEVMSAGVPVYAEIALDLPTEAQGEITVESVSADLRVVNSARNTTMRLDARLSTQGLATPGHPVLYTSVNRPAYFDSAVPLLQGDFAPLTTTPQHVADADHQLAAVLQAGPPRIWLIVSNMATQLGPLDVPPLALDLKSVTLHAVVRKSMASFAGGSAAAGM